MRGIKAGVNLLGLQPQLILGLLIVAPIIEEFGGELFVTSQELFVTSCVDGKHKRQSEHFQGTAVDLRFWGILPEKRELCAEDCQVALGDEFYFAMEHNHFHMHWAPKVGVNIGVNTGVNIGVNDEPGKE